METKTKNRKADPVIHVSPARHAQISKVAAKKGIDIKAAAELVFKRKVVIGARA